MEVSKKVCQPKMRVWKRSHFLILTSTLILSFLLPEGTTQIQPKIVGSIVASEATRQEENSAMMPTMFHYQVYPQQYPVRKKTLRKRCILTENGMKCKYRRDGQGDSYVMAAGGGGSSSSKGYAPKGMSGYGWGPSKGTDDDEGGGGGSGSFTGLLGLLGLKGLKGVKGLTGLGLLAPLLPLVMPFILPLIALPFTIVGTKLITLGILVLFKPLLIPGIGREFRGADGDLDFLQTLPFSNISRLAGDVVNTEECLERVACNVAKTSRKSNTLGWIDKLANILPEGQGGDYYAKIKKGLQFHRKFKPQPPSKNKALTDKRPEFDECLRFVCAPDSFLSSHQNNTIAVSN